MTVKVNWDCKLRFKHTKQRSEYIHAESDLL